MNKLKPSLRYMLLTFRLDQLWMPGVLWALFGLLTVLLKSNGHDYDMARGYLGAVLPLIAGIQAAYAFLEDPALELQFATPRPAWRLMLERLGLIGLTTALCALAFQLLTLAVGVDLTPLGSFAAIQMAWLVPTLAMMALGSTAAFSLADTTPGALLVGGIWIIQIVVRNVLADHVVFRYVYLFMGALAPDHSFLHANQIAVLIEAGLLLALGWMLFKRQERYL